VRDPQAKPQRVSFELGALSGHARTLQCTSWPRLLVVLAAGITLKREREKAAKLTQFMRPFALGTAPTSNQSLLGAALAGLLCFAPAACSSTDDGASGSSEAGATAAAGSTAAAGADGSLGGASDSSDGGAAGSAAPSLGGAGDSAGSADVASAGAGASTGGPASAGAASSTGGTAGAGADPNEPPHITSSKDVGVLTEADFKALCDARGGTVEVMPHCGGFATAKGFSYDSGTQLLSEHTCAGANTCGGWNCVLTD